MTDHGWFSYEQRALLATRHRASKTYFLEKVVQQRTGTEENPK